MARGERLYEVSIDMAQYSVTRNDIVAAFIRGLKPLDYIHALWEAGAAAFGRVDQWSDIDLYLVVDDDRIEETFRTIEKIVEALTGYDIKFRLPEPTWHGHSQIFYRLKRASPFLFLDIAVMKRSSKDKFLQYKIHGKPIVHFDKINIVRDDALGSEAFVQGLKGRLESLASTFDLFQVLTLKELNRGNTLEALSFYLGNTLRPLVEVLRIKYCPYHHNFHTSYASYDLPSQVVKRLQRLYYVASAEDLRQRHKEAGTWFWEVVKSIDFDAVKAMLV